MNSSAEKKRKRNKLLSYDKILIKKKTNISNSSNLLLLFSL